MPASIARQSIKDMLLDHDMIGVASKVEARGRASAVHIHSTAQGFVDDAIASEADGGNGDETYTILAW